MPTTKLVSQLAHAEILTPELDKSTDFFVNILGLTEVERTEKSRYLRCWGESFHSSIILTEGSQPGVAHIGWRAQGPDELELAVQRLEAEGKGKGWVDKSIGHGKAYQFVAPGGTVNEIFWDVERYQAPDELKSPFPTRVQKFPARGLNCREIDHVTTPTRDVKLDTDWWRDTLGFRWTEYQVLDQDDSHMIFTMLTVTDQSHTLGLLHDEAWVPGRVHHVAFWLDFAQELQRAVDVLIESGITIEYGPGRHGQGENPYLYFREPGGMRIELFSGGKHYLEPDWEAVKWQPHQGPLDITGRIPAPLSMLDAFPPSGTGITVEEGVDNPWTLEGVR